MSNSTEEFLLFCILATMCLIFIMQSKLLRKLGSIEVRTYRSKEQAPHQRVSSPFTMAKRPPKIVAKTEEMEAELEENSDTDRPLPN